ncbi:DUF4956 domain-containing protein [Alphaproteobacteria bacterium]|nr:DUF4956 domain-containing protein [Alphaproteobacteria bacterium]MDA9816504.1 DUF4956 domain-containing protein [Alphaproteobacteria bacterium]
MQNDIPNLDSYLSFTQTQIPLLEFLINMLAAIILSLVLTKVYERYGQSLSNRKMFGNIFIPIALTTMIIITIVKSSLALSLGLVGALSIVRFRSAIKEPEELVYLFACIAIGLGCGANQLAITVLGVVILLSTIIIFNKSSSKDLETNAMYLTISKQSAEKLNLDQIIEIIKSHSLELELKRLDEGMETSEVSFVTKFESNKKFIVLRDELLHSDSKLEITFLDNSKIF